MIDDWHLIDAVRLRPEIYDKTHPGFKIPTVKMQAWRNIAETLQHVQGDGAPSIPTKAVSARWNCLRERYTREVRKAESQRNDDSAPAWLHFSAMSFLHPYLRKRKSYLSGVVNYSPQGSPSPSVGPRTSCMEQQWVKSGEYPIVIDVPPDPMGSQSLLDLAHPSSPVSKPKLSPQKRHTASDPEKTSPQMDILRAINSDLTKMAQADPDYLIGKSVESVLKALKDPRLKIEFRRKFRDLISECEERLFDIH